MTGKDSIASGKHGHWGKRFFIGSPSLKRQQKVREDTGKRGSESTFVHFRQLSQKGWYELPPLGITGIDEHQALVSGEAGSGGVLSIFALFVRQYGGRALFRESTNVHFCHLRAKA